MNYNQNDKIAQITSHTLIVGVDIAKFKHVARAQDFRGIEFESACHFENTKDHFELFLDWIKNLMILLNTVLSGIINRGKYTLPNIPALLIKVLLVAVRQELK